MDAAGFPIVTAHLIHPRRIFSNPSQCRIFLWHALLRLGVVIDSISRYESNLRHLMFPRRRRGGGVSILVHLNKRVQQAAAEHGEYPQNAHDRRLVTPDVECHERLHRRLGRAGYVVRKRGRGLDLQYSDDADGEPEKPRHAHRRPESRRRELLRRRHDGIPLEDVNKG